MPLSRKQFKSEVVDLMEKGRLALSEHARLGHPERNIDLLEIRQCIRLGMVQDDPYETLRGDWKAEFFRHAAGKSLTVVVALRRETRAVVVTAYR
ncbi:DUF4258 domain-containing protein [Rhizobium sp. LjRoot254]|uniref:DUF4258 domain-containing protein n=1 Tax=Rhizobium sp. LjRoot254 TaxID=3342297 RepID=UPI003ED03F1C